MREAIKVAEESTSKYNKRQVNIAIGYDGRLEIVDAIQKIADKVKDGTLNPEDIDEKVVNEIYTQPDW